MHVILEVIAGPDAGRRCVLRDGESVTVGHGTRAELALPRDPSLAEVHFALECGTKVCRLRDLPGSRGVFLNGIKVKDASFRDGDRIVAGATTFAVRIRADAP